MDFSQRKGEMSNPTSIIYPRKFDTAIRNTFAKLFFKRIDDHNTTLDDLLITNSSIFPTEIEFLKIDETHFGYFLTTLLRRDRPISDAAGVARQVRRVRGVLHQILDIQLRYAHHQNHTNLYKRVFEAFQGKFQDVEVSYHVTNLLYLSQEFSKVISKSNEMYDRKYYKLDEQDRLKALLSLNNYKIKSIEMKLAWSGKMMLLQLREGTYLLPKSCILLYHNKICDLVSVLTLASYASISSMPFDMPSIVVTFCLELARLLKVYKTKFFHIVKALEGLGIGETIAETEDWVNREFLDSVVTSIRENSGFDYDTSSLKQLIQSVDVPTRHELMCLSKIVGHPFVDMELGTKSLFKVTHEPLQIDMMKVQKCICYFKRDYIKKHISKFRVWPPVLMAEFGTPTSLVQACIRGLDPDSLLITEKYGQCHIDDYVFVDLRPNMQFHKLENIIPHLKDKTISLLRSQVIAHYIDKTDVDMKWEDTRLLLTYLLSPTTIHDHVRYLDRYTYADDLDSLMNYLVIRVVPKEKELKVAYRGFGCKTYEDRHRGLAQEKNVMMFLDEYSDEQSMTISELSIIRKMDGLRRIIGAYKGYKVLYIVIDASKWNNHFRHETVDVVMAETLDKIFDYPIFSKTHKAYQKTLVYIPDSTGTWYWDGQDGGLEGLNQDTWVVTYLAQIKVAMEGLPFPYYVLCKGDDLRIAVLIPEKTEFSRNVHGTKNMIVNKISAVAKDLGHVINVEESYGSSKYFAFSKNASIEKVELPQTMRKIQKCYGANNAFINTTDNYIASTFSNAHSACKTHPIVIPCYCVGVFWAAWYIVTSPIYGKMSLDEQTGLLMTPSCVGGFPIIYLHNMPVRAESDLLSPFLGLMMFCRSIYPEVARTMEAFCFTSVSCPDSFVGIFIDSYSVPLGRPSLPDQELRGYILPALKTLSKNTEFKQLIAASESPSHKDLINAMNSCNILRAKILSVIYSATSEGVLKEVLKKFEAGQSVLNLLLKRYRRRQANRILYKIIRAEKRLQQWRYDVATHKVRQKGRWFGHLLTECPAESAHRVREFCWGRRVEDVTMPPLQHQLHIYDAASDAGNDWINNHHFSFYYDTNPILGAGCQTFHYSSGKRIPFIGYTTPSSSESPSVHFIEKDALVAKVKNLIDLVEWVNISKFTPAGELVTSNCKELIALVLQAYIDQPLDSLVPFASQKKSGTVMHHLRSPHYRESIVPNVLSNLYTLYSGESGTHKKWHNSKNAFRVNFLHCLTWGCWIGFNELEFGTKVTVPKELWGVTTKCKFCSSPIEEEPLVFDADLLSQVSILPLAITRIGEISEQILRNSIAEYVKLKPNIKEEGITITFEQACHGALQEIARATIIERELLQARFTRHSLSNEGFSILAALGSSTTKTSVLKKDLLKIPPTVVSYYIMFVIQEMIPKYLAVLSKAKIEAWLHTTPPQEIPWYHLIHWIYESGMLEAVVRSVAEMSNLYPHGNYYNISGTTKYVGLAYLQCLEVAPYFETIMILKNYNSESIKHTLASSIKSLLLTYIVNLTHVHMIPETPRHDDTREMIIKDVSNFFEALLVWYGGVLLLDELDTMAGMVEQTTVSSIYPFAREELTPDGLSTWYLELSVDHLPYIVQVILTKLKTRLTLLDIDADEYIFESFNTWFDRIVSPRGVPKMKVIYSSLHDCMQVLSAEQPDFSLEVDEGNEMNIAPSRVGLMRLSYNYSMMPGGAIQDVGHDLVHLDYYSEVIRYFDLANASAMILPDALYRTVGTDNASPSVLVDFLDALGLSANIIGRNISIACLCDGIGGFTSVFNQKCNNSIIVFHTKPDDPTIPFHPSAALYNNTSNTLVYQYINQGYYELTNKETCRAICGTSRAWDFVTSDLDYRGDDGADYLQVQKGILYIWLSRRKQVSALIMAINFYFKDENVKLLSMLAPYVLKYCISTPRSGSMRHKGYLIAYGYRHTMSQDFDCFTTYSQVTDERCLQTYNSFMRNLNTKIAKYSASRVQQYDLDRVDLTRYKKMSNVIGHPFRSEFIRLTGVSLNIDRLNHVDVIGDLQRPLTDTVVTSLGINLDRMISSLQDHLSTSTSIDTRRQTWDTNTQTHRRIIVNKLLLCLGWEYGRHLYLGAFLPYKVRAENVKDSFKAEYEALDPRDKISLDWDLIHAVEEDEFTNDYRYYKSYVHGLHLYFQFFGWCKLRLTRRSLATDESERYMLD